MPVAKPKETMTDEDKENKLLTEISVNKFFVVRKKMKILALFWLTSDADQIRAKVKFSRDAKSDFLLFTCRKRINTLSSWLWGNNLISSISRDTISTNETVGKINFGG